MSPNNLTTRPYLIALFSLLLISGTAFGCTDSLADSGADDGAEHDNTIGDDDDGDGNGDDEDDGDDANGNGDDDDDDNGDDGNGDDDPDETCDNLECDQVDCPPDEPTTTLTGTIYIPSGELPLPNASVYIPNDELEPFDDEVTCQQCGDMLSGDPIVETTTDFRGNFELDNVPVGDEIPLVIQTGKWRRHVEISNVEACQENSVDDADKLRLPRNRDEGEIPNIAVTTGGWDALECIPFEIGLDASEFTTEGGDGAVTIYNNGGSTGFTDDFGGQDFANATGWWETLEELEQFDMMLFSCDSNTGNAQVLQEYVDQGGRVFMTDLQQSWLSAGTDDFQSVADWGGTGSWTDEDGQIDTSFSDGQTMNQWMDYVGALDNDGYVQLQEVVDQITGVDDSLGTSWIFSDQGGNDKTHYFGFNTPVGADEDQQCGRVVYSEIHVVAGGDAEPYGQFPDNCGDADLSGQELALMYMLFDLSSCVVPDCQPLTCKDVGDECGTHSDGCGGSIDCGECCVDIDEPCDVDEDCCDDLWCNPDSGLCTDDCLSVGQTCASDDQCCSGSCAFESGADEGSCITG